MENKEMGESLTPWTNMIVEYLTQSYGIAQIKI